MTIVFVGSLVGLLVAMVPHMMAQMRLLATELPEALEQVQAWFRSQAGRGAGVGALGEHHPAGHGVHRPLRAAGVQHDHHGAGLVRHHRAGDVLRRAAGRVPRPAAAGGARRSRATAGSACTPRRGATCASGRVGKALTMLFIGVVTYVGLTLLQDPRRPGPGGVRGADGVHPQLRPHDRGGAGGGGRVRRIAADGAVRGGVLLSAAAGAERHHGAAGGAPGGEHSARPCCWCGS